MVLLSKSEVSGRGMLPLPVSLFFRTVQMLSCQGTQVDYSPFHISPPLSGGAKNARTHVEFSAFWKLPSAHQNNPGLILIRIAKVLNSLACIIRFTVGIENNHTTIFETFNSFGQLVDCRGSGRGKRAPVHAVGHAAGKDGVVCVHGARHVSSRAAACQQRVVHGNTKVGGAV